MKRATLEDGSIEINFDISIHALVKRATIGFLEQLKRIEISIHALVKRATSGTEAYIHFSDYFNPRPREEGDSIIRIFDQ